jgi:thiamine pyrophosphate-dependent acetolactate synthase large subunit-like protein
MLPRANILAHSLSSNLGHMIWIDGTYDTVAIQEEQKHGRPSGTNFGPVYPVKYARAFGTRGFMIRSPDQITSVLKQAFNTPDLCSWSSRRLSRQTTSSLSR